MESQFLTTESINQDTSNIDRLSSIEILKMMNREDQKVTEAIASVIPEISEVTYAVVESLSKPNSCL